MSRMLRRAVFAIRRPPIHFSSFDASNGTSLDAFTPEWGNAWTEQLGDWDIQSNQANMSSISGTTPNGVATTTTTVADARFSATVTPVSTGAPGIIFRYSDNNNFWFVQVNESVNFFQLFERNAGSFVNRGQAAVTINAGTSYSIVVDVSGTSITATLNGGNTVSYGSATFNQSQTTHGMRAFKNGDKLNDYEILT